MSDTDLFGQESPEMLTPLPEGGLLGLSMITAMRGIQRAQDALLRQVEKISASQHAIELKLAGMESLHKELENLKGDLADTKKELREDFEKLESVVESLRTEQHKRDGITWALEWAAKVVPWAALTAIAAWIVRGL